MLALALLIPESIRLTGIYRVSLSRTATTRTYLYVAFLFSGPTRWRMIPAPRRESRLGIQSWRQVSDAHYYHSRWRSPQPQCRWPHESFQEQYPLRMPTLYKVWTILVCISAVCGSLSNHIPLDKDSVFLALTMLPRSAWCTRYPGACSVYRVLLMCPVATVRLE
ncbi:hypothetical protein BDW71DRAFT_29951 [Aspergillus fruticulosus]